MKSEKVVARKLQTSMICMLLVAVSVGAQASPTLSLIHLFPSNNTDGSGPGVDFTDAAGNVYGVTGSGGLYGYGTVFTLSPPAQNGGTWTETILYNFTGGLDGKFPTAVVMDSQGVLYGTAYNGGTANQGVVFELVPDGQGGWTESVLYSFSGKQDGGYPVFGLTLDAAGNLYGATLYGGYHACDFGCGVVFRLSPNGGSWSESTLYSFHKDSGGYSPSVPLTLHAGKLYGATTFSDQGYGVVFELTISNRKYSVIHAFQGGTDGRGSAMLHFDPDGNIFSADDGGDPQCLCGEVYELSPPIGGQTTWTKSEIYGFLNKADGTYPGTPILARDGNLYGVTTSGGPGNGCKNDGGCGTIYRLSLQNGTWAKSTVYDIGGPYIYPSGLVRGPKDALLGTVADHVHGGTTRTVFALHGY